MQMLLFMKQHIEGDKNLANDYYHSHIDDVLSLMTEANVKEHCSHIYQIDMR